MTEGGNVETAKDAGVHVEDKSWRMRMMRSAGRTKA